MADPNPDRPEELAADGYEDITAQLTEWLAQVPAGKTFLAPKFTMEDAMHGWEVPVAF